MPKDYDAIKWTCKHCGEQIDDAVRMVQSGDRVFIYHVDCAPSGAEGIDCE